MLKRFSLICLVLLLSISCCFGDAESLYKAARQQRWSGQYNESQNTCAQVIAQFPEGEYAEKARLSLAEIDVLLLLEAGQDDTAAAGLEKMKADFQGHYDLPGLVYFIGKRYEEMRKYDQAKQIYQQVVNEYPLTRHAQLARMDTLAIDICLQIDAGQLDGIDTQLDKIMADFAGYSTLPKVVYLIAKRYEHINRYAKADRIYLQMIEKFPDNKYTSQARMDIRADQIVIRIKQGDYDQLLQHLDNIIANYSGSEYLYVPLFRIAEHYYDAVMKAGNMAELSNVASALEKIADKVGKKNSDVTLFVLHRQGNCHRLLGEYEKAIEAYQQILDKSPDYTKACEILFYIGRGYEKMVQTGQATYAEVSGQIEDAYGKIIDNYPDCPSAKYANSWLNKNK